ncbi:MAG TPA: hypothetical protein DCZ01_03720 [Elusimicrobia bacterium]|nr:MAG: hypothetical protein A2X37_05975 [Elusimicrobia bacterium GWA2_66_18]OGR70628.1 MAG: hypothetical protein A2X40_07655 [Elusimicrobia bacterium GWC2_65_9]HAZ07636.1 hypothetical protein [Elusimicrobiota bacterium]
MKTFATPGYIGALKQHGFVSDALFSPASMALSTLSKGGPTWIVGDPDVPAGRYLPEDEGRTLKIRAPFRFYAIRDDHPKDCGCGCGGGSVVTFLLPDEY